MQYISNTSKDKADILKAIGVASFESLVSTSPKSLRNFKWNLPAGASELEIDRQLDETGDLNKNFKYQIPYIGAGNYDHFIPAVIDRLALGGENTAFIMELPLYHLPTARAIGLLVWQRTLAFLQKAATIMVGAALVVWAAGVKAPDLPTCTVMARSFVRVTCAGNLYAITHRGDFDVAPSLRRCSAESTLMSMPSIS